MKFSSPLSRTAVATLVTAVLFASTSTTTTMMAQACSIAPRYNECVLSHIRVTTDPRIVQGTVERYGTTEYNNAPEETKLVWIDVTTGEVSDQASSQSSSPYYYNAIPSDDGPPPRLVDFPQKALRNKSGYDVLIKGRTVTIHYMLKNKYTGPISPPFISFDLQDGASFDPYAGDSLSWFFNPNEDKIYVLYAKNSYWGGVQVTQVDVLTGEIHVQRREDWNTDSALGGSAFAMAHGELDYYPALRTAVLRQSEAMCGGIFALYLDEWGQLQARPEISAPLFQSLDATPVKFGYDHYDHVAYELSENGSSISGHQSYLIETVKFSTGETENTYKICKSVIDEVGGCAVASSRPVVSQLRSGGGGGGRARQRSAPQC